MEFPVNDITELIPQKWPFVFVDALLYAGESSARSRFRVKTDGVFVQEGVFQEAGLLENIAQTAALHAGYHAKEAGRQVAGGYIGNVRNFEIFALPVTGDEIITEIEIPETIMNVAVVSGKILLSGKIIAACEMKVFASN